MTIEALIEQAVQRAIAPLVEEVRSLRQTLAQRDADDALDVEGLQALLGRPTRAALYQFLSRHPDCPVVRVGRKLTASRAAVRAWLESPDRRTTP